MKFFDPVIGRDRLFDSIFTITTILVSISSLFSGIIGDRCGLVVSNIISLIITSAGFLCLSLIATYEGRFADILD